MRYKPYNQRFRDTHNASGHWFVKANYLLSRGWTRVDGGERAACWVDPQTGAKLTLNKGVEVERGRVG